MREPSSLQSSGLTLRPLEPRSTTPGGRAASESERANRTSLRALLPTKSHASTSEHTSVRREHAQGSIRGPRIRAAATLDTGLRSASGGGGREGRSQARAIGTNRSQNRTNRAVADALCRRGRRGGVRLARSAAPTSRYAAVITPVPTEGQRRETKSQAAPGSVLVLCVATASHSHDLEYLLPRTHGTAALQVCRSGGRRFGCWWCG